MINIGSMVNTMYMKTLHIPGLKEEDLILSRHSLYNFDGSKVLPDEIMEMFVQLEPLVARTTFFVIVNNNPYNVILGLTWLIDVEAIYLPNHKTVKFIT